jgi:hypothetical protein
MLSQIEQVLRTSVPSEFRSKGIDFRARPSRTEAISFPVSRGGSRRARRLPQHKLRINHNLLRVHR